MPNHLGFEAASLIYTLVKGGCKKHQLVLNGSLALCGRKKDRLELSFFPFKPDPLHPKDALLSPLNTSLFLYVFQWWDASCAPLIDIWFMSVILSKWPIKNEALDNLPPNSKFNNWFKYHGQPIVIYHSFHIAVYVLCMCAWEGESQKDREREKKNPGPIDISVSFAIDFTRNFSPHFYSFQVYRKPDGCKCKMKFKKN